MTITQRPGIILRQKNPRGEPTFHQCLHEGKSGRTNLSVKPLAETLNELENTFKIELH